MSDKNEWVYIVCGIIISIFIYNFIYNNCVLEPYQWIENYSPTTSPISKKRLSSGDNSVIIDNKEGFTENFTAQPKFLTTDDSGNLSVFDSSQNDFNTSGNINVKDGVFTGNISTGGNITTSGTVTGGNITTTGIIKGDYDYDVYTNPMTTSDHVYSPDTSWVGTAEGGWDVSLRGVGRLGYKTFNDREGDSASSDRWVDIKVPDGMRTGHLFHLPWENCRYFDIFGILPDGRDLFIRRVNSYQKGRATLIQIETNHDGVSSVTIHGVNRFAKIRIRGAKGKIHYLGVGWNKQRSASGSDSGWIHSDNIVGNQICLNGQCLTSDLILLLKNLSNDGPGMLLKSAGSGGNPMCLQQWGWNSGTPQQQSCDGGNGFQKWKFIY
jgi:hypothetical protein